ncbi:MAG: GDP-mannose 4,6-dehydratase [Candidatus Saganbacteria bacterium]|nr:GDP-mannose 4,6-dehydratase [Candidatus Saganbacteria bacterium]
MKALITGINGFAGSFLAEHLLQQGWQVSGMVQPGTGRGNIEEVKQQLVLFETDLMDKTALDKVVASARPQTVFHLAGASSVKESFDVPERSFEVNVLGSLNLLNAVHKHVPESAVLLVTSSEIYGESLSPDKVTDENSRILPKSPYAVSKAAQDMLGRVYARALGQRIIIARPCSHIGPRQSDMFFVPTVARQIAAIVKRKNSPELALGNLDVHRDFTDVRDMVAAYVLLSQKGEVGEAYNICSGKSRRLTEIVDMLIGLSGKRISIKLDPERMRRSDLIGMKIDHSKLERATGWSPKISLERSLKDILTYWLDRTP